MDTARSPRSIVVDVLVPRIVSGLASHNSTARLGSPLRFVFFGRGSNCLAEFVRLLEDVLARYEEVYPELRVLADADLEVDFFRNIIHIQMHRRVRAMLRIEARIEGVRFILFFWRLDPERWVPS